MTQQHVYLPAPQYPMVMRMVTDPIMGEDEVAWVVSQPHPFVQDAMVVRMFLDRGRVTLTKEKDGLEIDGNFVGAVEVYSVSADGETAIRNTIPLNTVRVVEEAMPIDIFVEELAVAEGVDLDQSTDQDPARPQAESSSSPQSQQDPRAQDPPVEISQ